MPIRRAEPRCPAPWAKNSHSHDVVDVGDGEQPGGLPDDAQAHEWMSSPSERVSR